MAKSKLSKALKNSYVQTAVWWIILVGAIFAFRFGLQSALRTEYPLQAVASGSMEPTLYRGDLILVQGIMNFSELNVGYKNAQVPGEIIVYRVPPEFSHYFSDPNELIVHRAVRKEYKNNSWYFYTLGDASSSSSGNDPWNPIRQDYIVGKVVGKVPWIGYVPLFMREHPLEGFFLVAVLFIILIVVDFGFPGKEKNEKKQEIKNSEKVDT